MEIIHLMMLYIVIYCIQNIIFYLTNSSTVDQMVTMVTIVHDPLTNKIKKSFFGFYFELSS